QVLGESFTRPPPAAAAAPAPSVANALPTPSEAPPTTAGPPVFTPVTTTTQATSTTTPTAAVAAAPVQLAALAVTTTTTGTTMPDPALVAVDDVVVAAVKGAVRVDVLANDSEPGSTLVPRSVSIVVPPQHGKAKPNKDGRVHYEPAHGYAGPDSFRYSVCDTAGHCLTAEVTLTVAGH